MTSEGLGYVQVSVCDDVGCDGPCEDVSTDDLGVWVTSKCGHPGKFVKIHKPDTQMHLQVDIHGIEVIGHAF